MAEDMEVLGFPPEAIAKARNDAYFWVYPENWQAVKVFLSLGTQWKMLSNGFGSTIQGLDYCALAAVLAMLDIEDKADIFHKIQVLESGALAALRAQKN